MQTIPQTIYTMPATAAALASFTTAASAVPNGVYTFPANFFQLGTKFRVHASGVMSSYTSGTFTFSVQLGSTSILQSLGTIQPIASQTNQKWNLDLEVECRAIGAGTSTTFVGTGLFTCSTALLAVCSQLLPASGAIAAGTGVDNTATQALALYVACSVSNAANAITVEQYDVTILAY